MDEVYQQIGLLTAEYIELNNQFIEALNNDQPADELSMLKEKIKTILEKIEELEKARSSASSHDKDSSVPTESA